MGLQIDQLKKKQKKAGAKKEDKEKAEASPAESSKVEDTTITPPAEEAAGDATGDEPKATTTEGDKAGDKDAEEKVSELNSTKSHQRQPSLSVQSKMRSSSFRQGSTSGGPLSPNFGFSPEGDTAPDIYRKQAIRIEELEKENKRLSKDASDGEKRWKKAEEELDELREAEDDSKPKDKVASSADGSSKELEKLVCVVYGVILFK